MTTHIRLESRQNTQHNHRTGGLVLIGIGLFLLISRVVDAPDLKIFIPLAIGLAFICWGILAREAGPMIPGGIMTGIGTGVLAVEGPLGWLANRLELDDGGIFMLCFAGGWILIVLLTMIFTEAIQWWPLIPAAVMALVGMGILFGGIAMALLSLLGNIWPMALIIAGGVLLWRIPT